MNQNTIYFNFFGGLSIIWQGKQIDTSYRHGYQIWLFLTYLIQNRGNPCSVEELCSILNISKRSTNPANALKTSVCRVRSFLDSFSPGLGRSIRFRLGSYMWDSPFDIVTDLEQFDLCLKKASDCRRSAVDRLEACQQAIAIYKNGLPKRFDKIAWFHALNLRYHNGYIEVVQKAIDLLEQFRDYDQIVTVCNQLLLQEPCNEAVHRSLIKALHKLGKIDEAKDRYYQAINLFYHTFSVAPTNAFHDLYLLLMGNEACQMKDIGTLTLQLAEEEKIPGAFYCEFAVFKTIYQAEYRAGLRTGIFPILCLFTVKEKPAFQANPRHLKRTMEALGDKIHHSLRTGDVYTRIGPLQYAVLFSQNSFEGGCIAARRIVSQARRGCPVKDTEIIFSLQSDEPKAE